MWLVDLAGHLVLRRLIRGLVIPLSVVSRDFVSISKPTKREGIPAVSEYIRKLERSRVLGHKMVKPPIFRLPAIKLDFVNRPIGETVCIYEAQVK